MKAIILAGGLGTRLRPLTLTTPKPMIDVNGITLTEHVFAILKKLDVDEIYLSISYLADVIQNYFGDGSKWGIKIHYLVEPEPMGTAGPLLLLKKSGQIIDEDFVTVNGDNLFNFAFSDWLVAHHQHKAGATIALKEIDDVESRGVVELDGNRIIRFVEKPKREDAPSNLINSGYYIFSPKVFEYIDATLSSLTLERDIFPAMAADGQLFGFIGHGQWFDTGTFERYEQVKREWKGVI